MHYCRRFLPTNGVRTHKNSNRSKSEFQNRNFTILEYSFLLISARLNQASLGPAESCSSAKQE
jgi:hypothetical protein